MEHLRRWAHAREKAHRPAWKEWVRRWGLSRAVGIWHELCVVQRGQYECVYQRMPPLGLGRVGTLVEASGLHATAQQRPHARTSAASNGHAP